jgi:hypothetical protein
VLAAFSKDSTCGARAAPLAQVAIVNIMKLLHLDNSVTAGKELAGGFCQRSRQPAWSAHFGLL